MKSLIFCLTLFLAAVLHSTTASAAAGNKKIIVTDVLDDDIRAILHMLTDPSSRSQIDAFVVSTGNVQLKSAILQKIINGLGLNIPVWTGTATNLNNNSTTAFAGNNELEGGHLISRDERRFYNSVRGKSGDASKRIAALLESLPPKEKIDMLLITAPTDVVSAIRLAPTAARDHFGDLFTMGLWKENKGKLMAPYNTMADPDAVMNFIRMVNGGTFQRVFHVPSDTVQQRSGLPGGYFPEDGAGLRYRQELTNVMQKHPLLKDVFTAAQEYGLAWEHTARQQFGIGLNEADRWVPSSFKDPADAAGFYLADTAPTHLAFLPESELTALPTKVRSMSSTGSVDFRKGVVAPFELLEAPGGRSILDVQSLDGPAMLDKHLKLLQSAAITMPPSPGYRAALPGVDLSSFQDAATHVAAPSEKKALLMTFKNSPDDWFGLIQILGTEHGREALKNGGIVAEGFDTVEMAHSIQNVLKDLGHPEIRVAVGHQYAPGEIDAIPNFQLEKKFSEQRLGGKAFVSLPPATKETQPLEKADDLFRDVAAWSEKNGAKYDHVILGEGIDYLRAVESNPELAKNLGSIFAMGGGRYPAGGELQFTRNWLPHKQEVLGGLEKLGADGKKVWVFSSDQFGGSLVSSTKDKLGNSEVIFSKLADSGDRHPALRAIADHWTNWGKNADWFFGAGKRGAIDGAAFDATKNISKVTISPLGLTIADEWLKGDLESGVSPLQFNEVDLAKIAHGDAAAMKSGSGVRWIYREGPADIVPLANRFADTLGNIEISREAAELHRVVQSQGLSQNRKAADRIVRLNDGVSCDQLFKKIY
ncbi:MAG: nucleoside hydrolase [Bdellovibrionota bacterium]